MNTAANIATDGSVVAGTTVTAGTGITATTGNIVASAGDLNAVGGHRKDYLWSQADCTASQSAVAMAMHGGDAAITGVPMARAGSITALTIQSENARSAGTCTVAVTKNGTATAVTAVLNGTNTTKVTTASAKDTVTFAAGDVIGCKVTTDGDWAAGSTPSLLADVEVEC